MFYEFNMYEEGVLASIKSKQLSKEREMELKYSISSGLNRKAERRAVIHHLLIGAGNALVQAGTKLLKIA